MQATKDFSSLKVKYIIDKASKKAVIDACSVNTFSLDKFNYFGINTVCVHLQNNQYVLAHYPIDDEKNAMFHSLYEQITEFLSAYFDLRHQGFEAMMGYLVENLDTEADEQDDDYDDCDDLNDETDEDDDDYEKEDISINTESDSNSDDDAYDTDDEVGGKKRKKGNKKPDTSGSTKEKKQKVDKAVPNKGTALPKHIQKQLYYLSIIFYENTVKVRIML